MRLPLRGPHSGNELTLMLLGIKPCAMIYRPDDMWAAAVLRGKIKHAGGVLDNQVFVLEGHEDKAIEVRSVFAERDARGYMTREDHQRLGRAFGYPEEAIEAFLADRDGFVEVPACSTT